MGKQFTDLPPLKNELEKADYAISLRRYDLALEIVQGALLREPENVLALYTLARIYFIKSRFSEANTTICEALRQNPEHGSSHMLYGMILQRQNLSVQAEKEYMTAIELQPFSVNAHYNYGSFLLTVRKDTTKAREHCIIALQQNPQHLSANGLLAKICLTQGDIAEAESTYLHGLSIDPENAELHNSYGALLYTNKHDPKTAFEHFRTALMYNPTDENYKKNFFLALKAKNRFYWLFWHYARLRHKHNARWIFIQLCILALIRASMYFANQNPIWFPITIIIASIYVLFTLYVMTINSIFNQLIKRGWIK